ncbi:MAG: anhydro-N-acetylmuramic acid kinase [Bacteroidota bacterium]
MKKVFTVLGGMAGSSMDGLDLALVRFQMERRQWRFELLKCITVMYPESLFVRLKDAPKHTTKSQRKLDIDFGHWIAIQVLDFIQRVDKPEILAIHGHTLIHSPEKKISWQLGSGKIIANHTGIITITDFRAKDIQLGGEGAPLVPFGDFQLFSDYEACLNLGGIANLSIRSSKIAGDICPCNQVLNYYSHQIGLPFDDSGKIAEKGKINTDFLIQLGKLSFFKKSFPKSLPNHSIPYTLLDSVNPSTGLRSYSEFIAIQVCNSLRNIKAKNSKLLISGGGAFNSFLISLIQERLPKWNVTIPSNELVSFKEAIIFGFLGLMTHLDEVNVLSTVTGASQDTSSGVIHLPK